MFHCAEIFQKVSLLLTRYCFDPACLLQTLHLRVEKMNTAIIPNFGGQNHNSWMLLSGIFYYKHLISTYFKIILWGEYNPCMVLPMKVAHVHFYLKIVKRC